MTQDEIEDLFLRSLDNPLSDDEKNKLKKAIETKMLPGEDVMRYNNIRSSLHRESPATFGPYFAQKVITKIQGMRAEIDQQIVFFFKKYQLAALGVFVVLLSVNIIFSDEINIPAILGIEETVVADTPEDDIEEFDFLEALNSN